MTSGLRQWRICAELGGRPLEVEDSMRWGCVSSLGLSDRFVGLRRHCLRGEDLRRVLGSVREALSISNMFSMSKGLV